MNDLNDIFMEIIGFLANLIMVCVLGLVAVFIVALLFTVFIAGIQGFIGLL